jgi:hypothetical protein
MCDKNTDKNIFKIKPVSFRAITQKIVCASTQGPYSIKLFEWTGMQGFLKIRRSVLDKYIRERLSFDVF